MARRSADKEKDKSRGVASEVERAEKELEDIIGQRTRIEPLTQLAACKKPPNDFMNKKLTEQQKQEILKLRNQRIGKFMGMGVSVSKIAKQFGVSAVTVYLVIDDKLKKRQRQYQQSDKYRQYQKQYYLNKRKLKTAK